MNVDEQTIQRLDFDSDFWGLEMVQSPWPLSALEAAGHSIEFGQMLIDVANLELIIDATDRGYDIADIRVTLDRPLTRRPPVSVEEIRPFVRTDLPALIKIARRSHRITRFYADLGFPDERCDDLYETWIRNSVDGWAHTVLVAGVGPVGYCTVHVDDGVASIGLIAVEGSARGRGVGQRLVHGAIWRGYQAGADRMTVVTQGRNIQAQRVFQRCGFRTTSTEIWLHKHFR